MQQKCFICAFTHNSGKARSGNYRLADFLDIDRWQKIINAHLKIRAVYVDAAFCRVYLNAPQNGLGRSIRHNRC
jgi:hypothetical protein